MKLAFTNSQQFKAKVRNLAKQKQTRPNSGRLPFSDLVVPVLGSTVKTAIVWVSALVAII